MPDFPTEPMAPAEFMEKWLPAEFAAKGLPPGSEELDVKLGIQLDGEGGGEWVLHMNKGTLAVVAGSREDTAFSYVQSVEDWRGALWEGRGGALAAGFARFFRPGSDLDAGAVGSLGGAPPPQALSQLERLDGCIRIVVTGGESGDWGVGLRLGPGPVPEEATCTVSISAEDAEALSSGELDAMQAFMGGKMVVTGDMTLMLQMQAVMMQAAQDGAG